MRTDTRSWFERRTYHGRHYTPSHVAAAKRGRTVSVVLPARNEEETVGPIVRAIRERLVEDVRLVDEILVIDSHSTDRTAARARAAGARVERQGEILPELGDVPGKGEALWKSLAVTRGDVVAFCDADLRDFDPQFVVGLLAPVLCEGVDFVKGCYDRPLASGETVLPAGGGRVTELVARPLLNLYWPELAGFVQPLAGEYAGTRACLESVPFVSGYGVEIGLMIDLVEKYGLDRMAQVDLGVRRHRNSSDDQLSRMAAQIQLTVHSRLGKHRRMVCSEEPAGELVQFTRCGDAFDSSTTEIVFGERPRMVDVRAGRRWPQAVGL